jgi:beta-galactosidase/beta-glucuronidase
MAFLLGDPSGADAHSFRDEGWRTVDLPHDWSIEGQPDRSNTTGSGGGYFPVGTGWYRKTFRTPSESNGKRVSVEFDGVYRNAAVYLNGCKLGTHPSGYTSFRFDLTPVLDLAAPNVLAVRVDNSAQPNSRWYSGSGISRHVRVVVVEPIHVAHWGVFVTTPQVSSRAARVIVRTRVANESATEAGLIARSTPNRPKHAATGIAQAPGSSLLADAPADWSAIAGASSRISRAGGRRLQVGQQLPDRRRRALRPPQHGRAHERERTAQAQQNEAADRQPLRDEQGPHDRHQGCPTEHNDPRTGKAGHKVLHSSGKPGIFPHERRHPAKRVD